jgi:integrative and conjugative element protein (TIGR02256 family)
VPTIQQIRLTPEALAFIRNEAQAWPGVETGGVLIGSIEDGTATITRATGPGPKGQRKPASVYIDGEYTGDVCWEHQRAKEGEEHYLGDWHTHPNGVVSLSGMDVQAGITMITSGATFVPEFLSLIVSPEDMRIGAFVIGEKGQNWRIPAGEGESK